jgi:hypothetical protein
MTFEKFIESIKKKYTNLHGICLENAGKNIDNINSFSPANCSQMKLVIIKGRANYSSSSIVQVSTKLMLPWDVEEMEVNHVKKKAKLSTSYYFDKLEDYEQHNFFELVATESKNYLDGLKELKNADADDSKMHQKNKCSHESWNYKVNNEIFDLVHFTYLTLNMYSNSVLPSKGSDGHIEAVRRLIINPIVLAASCSLKTKWIVEQIIYDSYEASEQSNSLGWGSTDYFIESAPVTIVAKDDTEQIDYDTDNNEKDFSTEDQECAVNLTANHYFTDVEAKRNSKMNDSSLAQVFAEMHDTLMRYGSNGPGVCGILCSGHRWMFFTMKKFDDSVHGKKCKVLYHGMLDMPCLSYAETTIGEERLSGLNSNDFVNEEKILKVLIAVRYCIDGTILTFHK